MDSRFITPDEIDWNKITVFPVFDTFRFRDNKRWEWYERADMFGLAFKEGSSELSENARRINPYRNSAGYY